mgnify:CR=1 FL=1|tara:strand:+ start:98 stop:832 length:735 start_codon:yes stop_codon:yes gene_type:complete
MKTFLILIIMIFVSFAAKSDQIYQIIKLPNLEIYNNSKSKVKFFYAKDSVNAGMGINSINCEKPIKKDLDNKIIISNENLKKYSSFFLNKINLKYLVFCDKLKISEISAHGFANPQVRTIVLNTSTHKKIFNRILHHEIFHIIHHNHKTKFNEKEWRNFNKSNFLYSNCSSCENSSSLKLLKSTNGFFTDYSKYSVSEDMAETFSFIMTENNMVKELLKNDKILREKVKFIKKKVLKVDNSFKF